jgi:hypothetical protein
MRSNDYCMGGVATFDRLAGRDAEKCFRLELYDRSLGRFVNRIASRGASVPDVACGPSRRFV